MSRQPLIVGLAGGIASGKSTVEAAFAELSVPVIDADQVARAVVEPGQAALVAIRERFGDDVILSDGTLDRRALRSIVFADAAARKDLEGITHPAIRRQLLSWKESLSAPYGLLSAAILLEAGLDDICHRVLVIDVPTDVQRQRLMQRDGIDATLADQMLSAQLPRAERVARADDVLVNDGVLDAISPAVARLHAHYLSLAAGDVAPEIQLRLP